jgi:hypothetical protein
LAAALGREGGVCTLIDVDFRYTGRQVARGSRPDASDGGGEFYLLKRVTRLRLTYQIRLLTFMAQQAGGHLTIRVPRGTRTSADLREFLRRQRRYVRLENVD